MSSPALNASDFSASLTASDIEASVRFYTEGLGFEVAEQMEVEGKLRYAELQGGAAHIVVSQDDFAKGRDRVKGVGVRFYLETDQDITALAERARAGGVTLDSEPAALPWGPLAFMFTDPDGFKFTVANRRE